MCFCVFCFVKMAKCSAGYSQAISRYSPNLHAVVLFLIPRCCFMYWTWVKIGVPSTVKMTPNRRIVFQEYFSLYAGLFGQPKVIRRSASWDYIFPPGNLSPVFLHCMIKAPKAQGSSFTSSRSLKICATYHYGPFYLNILAKWIWTLHRTNSPPFSECTVSCWDIIQLSVWMSILILGYLNEIQAWQVALESLMPFT